MAINDLNARQQQEYATVLVGLDPRGRAAAADLIEQMIRQGNNPAAILQAVKQYPAYRQAIHPAATGSTTTPTTPTPPATSPATPAAPDPDAFAQLVATLNQYGLGSLADWAWGELVAGKTQSQVVLDLYQTQQFKDAYPEIGLRQQNGLPAVSVSDILDYRNQAVSLFHAAGLPASYWQNTGLISQAIGGDVSLNELQSRINMASQAVNSMPQAVRDAFQRDYGVSAGDLTRTFLDLKTPEPQLAQEFLAAQIGGAGTLAGYKTDRGVDERLAADQVTFSQAQAGFNDLGLKHQLFKALPGEAGFSGVSQDQQLAAEFEGNAAAQQMIQREQKRRVAEFSGGGAFATSQQGYTGLGTAQ